MDSSNSPTATITFSCYAGGRVACDLWHDNNARDRGTRNAVAIERLVRLAMSAPQEVRETLVRALDRAETAANNDRGGAPDPDGGQA